MQVQIIRTIGKLAIAFRLPVVAGLVAVTAALMLPIEAGAQSLPDLQARALQGDVQAQMKVGDHYFYGDYRSVGDYAEALRWYKMAAEAGDADGQGRTGSMYSGMKGVPKDIQAARYWFDKAIAQGSGAAAYNLHNLCVDLKDYDCAIDALRTYIALDRPTDDDLYYTEEKIRSLQELRSRSGAQPPVRTAAAVQPPASVSGVITNPEKQHYVHNPAASAMDCVSFETQPSGAMYFINGCGVTAEVFWCSVPKGECERGTGSTWSIKSGMNWKVSGDNYMWGACLGANSGSFDRGTNGERFTCREVDPPRRPGASPHARSE